MRIILLKKLPARIFLIGITLFCLLSCSDSYKKEQQVIEKMQVEAQQLKEELIADLEVNSARATNWTLIFSGSRMYSDRNYIYSTVPPELTGNLVLQPANDDKFYKGAAPPFITFRLKKSAKIYVLFTPVSTTLVTQWLNEKEGWVDEEFVVETSIGSFKARRFVKSQYFPEDALVEFGGNGCLVDNCDTFTVVIIPEIKGSENTAEDLDNTG